MFGTPILEVAIGLIFVYMLFSLVASACLEFISGCFAWRAKNLELALLRFTHSLNHGNTESKTNNPFLLAIDHPLIKSIANAKPDILGRARKPSYIPPRLFALAMLDSLSPQAGNKGSMPLIRNKIDSLDNDDIKRLLTPLINHAGEDIDKAIHNLEGWFNNLMERASGWYKRKTQLWIAAISLAIVCSLNIDSIMIINYLWRDSSVRNALVEQASNIPKTVIENRNEGFELALNKLQARELPLGWKPIEPKEQNGSVVAPNQVPNSLGGWTYKIIGLFFSAIAISLGAPFWFELLNKLVNLRSSGSRPGTTAETKR